LHRTPRLAGRFFCAPASSARVAIEKASDRGKARSNVLFRNQAHKTAHDIAFLKIALRSNQNAMPILLPPPAFADGIASFE
jgi:hypothetical protein